MYIFLSPLVFGLPLSVCSNYGKSVSNSLKAKLAVKGAMSADELFAKAVNSPHESDQLLAHRYWRWQAALAFCAGLYFFWAIALIHHLVQKVGS